MDELMNELMKKVRIGYTLQRKFSEGFKLGMKVADGKSWKLKITRVENCLNWLELVEFCIVCFSFNFCVFAHTHISVTKYVLSMC